MLVAGPAPGDPFTICKEIAEALPEDRQAAGLCDGWREEFNNRARQGE
jgi:hypothetical protein